MQVTASERAGVSAFGAALSDPESVLEVLDALSEAVYLVDRGRTIRFWNKACERITGFAASEVVGRNCYAGILQHIDDEGMPLCFRTCPLAHTMADGEPRRARVWLHHKRGHRLAVCIAVNPIRDRDGTVIGAIETFTDDSGLLATQQRIAELEHLAMADPLTQVPNRRFLDLTLPSRLNELRRHGVPFVLAFCDVDEFKSFNDENGHGVGDQVLRMVATTLAAEMRGSDTIVRYGGEEFVLLMHHATAERPDAGCERLRRLVAASSLDLSDRRLSVTMSFGATLARRTDTPDLVMHRADHLLYRSKQAGRNVVTTDL